MSRRPLLLLCVLALAGLAAARDARAEKARGLLVPPDPLRSTVGLSFGVLELADDDYADFFDRGELNTWCLRYDYRAWGPLRLGVAISASDKSEVERELSLGSGNYPVRYRFTAFTALGEFFLRSQLPRLGPLYPQVSAGLLVSRIHAESSGYSQGYDAAWEDYRPIDELVRYGHGWRAAVGVQWPIWANVALFVEASRQELDRYDAPTDRDPPVGKFSHSGDRLEAGLVQRF